MAIEIGKRCKIINARLEKNDGVEVVVVGDAGVASIRGFGKSQCYYIDRELETIGGYRRNWSTEYQLQPIDDLTETEYKKSKIEQNVVA